MEVVIKIPDYNLDEVQNGSIASGVILKAVKNGTLLPKGHGRLIDADKLDTRERGNNSQRTMWWNIECIVEDAETIIEADKKNDDETDN